MKIGIVCYPTYGGSGVVATELGLGLARKGHKVHFITYKRPPRLSVFQENIFFHEVNSMSYPLFEYTPYETALASKLVDVVQYENLDLLHVHYAIPHAAVAYMAKQILKSQGKLIPIVTTLHGTDITLVGADVSFAPVVEFSIKKLFLLSRSTMTSVLYIISLILKDLKRQIRTISRWPLLQMVKKF